MKKTTKRPGRLPGDLFTHPLEATAPAASPQDGSGPDEPTSPLAGRRLTPASALGPAGYAAGGRRPAGDLLDVPPVRVTAYLTPDQLARLRAEALQRQRRGLRADVSALIREAIDAHLPTPSSLAARAWSGASSSQKK